ncbi:hypothetical protein BDZ89DRAFT_975973 [Hymenopellis radicata]|nr:hypothetical protein BDZ89DRAFT_975973 [Hymenopellis radicata]
MSARYAPLPARPDRDAQHEMDAAFDDSDDEDDINDASESQPLNPTPSSPQRGHRSMPSTHIPGTYDFENVDYDYPPPGSPPPPSATALPNSIGNSNGLIPSFNIGTSRAGPRRGWLQRSAGAILPTPVMRRLGLAPQRPEGVIGGGTNNDGVFANVTAKPTRPMHIQDGDEILVVPEDTQAEAPPSYASAQADSVPPYWETTVHAPFSPDSMGELMIDALPTGSLFSFLCNMLVSISFQFIGFLLTYLLHTSHAARLGSRAGLGVTLIQYGFALRGRLDDVSDGEGAWGQWRSDSANITWPSAPDADSTYYNNATSPTDSPYPGLTEEQAGQLVADATTEWLSFFLMTVGWFVLLTSLLGFWRVKRWERSIMATQQTTPATTTEGQGSQPVMTQFERAFGLHRLSSGDFFRQGFVFGGRRDDDDDDDDEARALAAAEEGHSEEEIAQLLAIAPDDPDRARIITAALDNERRLQQDLRAAGLL